MLNKLLIGPATLFCLSLVQVCSQAAAIEYTVDSFSDGVTGSIVGGSESAFELYGVGYTQVDSTLYFGLNTNLPIGGYFDAQARGGSIAWGDLFLNVSDQPFADALAAGDVYGIRFDAANDSFVSELGLYQVQATESITPFNSGFQSLGAYRDTVTSAGGIPSLGAAPLDGSYLSNMGLPQNVIGAGTLLSDQITFIEDFSAVGFASDFGFSSALSETGSFTYGFSIDVTDFPVGDFVAHLLAECANDAILFEGAVLAQLPSPDPQSVPEPGMMLAFLGLGVVLRMGYPKRA